MSFVYFSRVYFWYWLVIALLSCLAGAAVFFKADLLQPNPTTSVAVWATVLLALSFLIEVILYFYFLKNHYLNPQIFKIIVNTFRIVLLIFLSSCFS